MNRVQRSYPAGVAVVLFICLVCGVSRVEALENLLVPGADFSQLVLKKGAWCRYVVVDEALGQVDSTEVYVGIPARETTPRGPAFWLELSTRPLGTGQEEAQILKLLVLETITGFSEGDSLGDYVPKLYIRKGTRPVSEEDPRTYKDLSLIVPTAESSWESSEGAVVTTPAGRFICTEKTRAVDDDQEIPTGGIKLIKKSRDDYTAWFCGQIPVFRMVKCVIQRSRETDTVPRMTGIPVSGKKYSKTTAELVGFGLDAKPILSLEPAKR